MKAIRVQEPGAADVLQVEEVEVPKPGPGQVLVQVEAAGVNFIEIYQRSGLYPLQPPFTPGSEGAGRVVAAGAEVEGLAPGDRVASIALQGAYAEFALANAQQVVPLPDDVATRTAAAVMLQGITAHYLATSTFALQRGDWCLVHAGAGGVGLLLTQIAVMRGARVISTVSTPEKAALARDAGAEQVILYTEADFVSEVREVTRGRGVDVVYDSVGRTTFEGSLDCLRPRGTLVLFGQSSGPVPPFDPQVLNRKGSLFLTRPTIAHYVATRDELLARTGDLFRWLGDGALSVRVDRVTAMSEAAEAHRALEGRMTTGKVLLVPRWAPPGD